MFRRSTPTWVALASSVVCGLGSASVASAESGPSAVFTLDTPVSNIGESTVGARRDVIVVPPRPGDAAALVSPIIYLNRCTGGCTLKTGSDDDAVMNTTPLVEADTTLSAFTHGEQAWQDLLTCMREIFSPFDVQITDVRPGAGTQYHMAVVAGTSTEANKPGTLGVAFVNSDCSPRNNTISLSFANSHGGTGVSLTQSLCHTVGQESAHAYGLDHAFKFSDGRSTCNDPMTYQSDCGGQRFYRNDSASCGEFAPRACGSTGACGSSQNAHAKLLTVFGPSNAAPLIAPPTAMVTTPTAGGTLGAIAAAQAGSKRGVAKVELLLNGFKWAEAKGAQFGQNGQPNPSAYSMTVPSSVPNSKIDVVVRACDDLGKCTDSAPVLVTKGAPCTAADTCAKGQKCEDGKCFWDQPAGELGAACDYPQFCKSLRCEGPADAQICSQGCVPGTGDSCPEGLECLETGPGQGICYTAGDEGGGCCSVGGDDGPAPWALHGGVAALLLGLMLRRRRS